MPRIAPRCRQPARHRPVPGELPQRQRPRRADEHRAPRRAARPLGRAPCWPGSCASPARAVTSTSSPTASCSAGLPGIANTGGWASQGTSHARGNGRPPGRWARVTHRAAWSDALACSRGRGQRARVGFRPCSCGEAAKAAWALDTPGLPEPPGQLPPGDLDSVSGWARLYYRRAAELFETATRGMRGGRRTVRR
jgi:hypothetical protein